MTPSNANTSGLAEKLLERARVSTDPLLAMYASQASKQLVTAASAQARIAELERQVREAKGASEAALREWDGLIARTHAAEARADRLAKALEEAIDLIAHLKPERARFKLEQACAALQQETQK